MPRKPRRRLEPASSRAARAACPPRRPGATCRRRRPACPVRSPPRAASSASRTTGRLPRRASGFDCSGLTSWAWARAGKALPHSSRAQYASLPHVPLDQLQPGRPRLLRRPEREPRRPLHRRRDDDPRAAHGCERRGGDDLPRWLDRRCSALTGVARPPRSRSRSSAARNAARGRGWRAPTDPRRRGSRRSGRRTRRACAGAPRSAGPRARRPRQPKPTPRRTA